ncbi:MAG: nucleotidyltransferase family protein [Paracoccaceae bacterium]
MSYDKIIAALREQPQLMECLRDASRANLPDWRIVGGAVRDVFWSKMHPSAVYNPKDIDLIFFDLSDLRKETENEVETYLSEKSGLVWSVKNQARMHLANNDQQYSCTLDAMSKFPLRVDTSGLVAASNNEPILSTIYGYQDLLEPLIRPTRHFQANERQSQLKEYIRRKNFAGR